MVTWMYLRYIYYNVSHVWDSFTGSHGNTCIILLCKSQSPNFKIAKVCRDHWNETGIIKLNRMQKCIEISMMSHFSCVHESHIMYSEGALGITYLIITTKTSICENSIPTITTADLTWPLTLLLVLNVIHYHTKHQICPRFPFLRYHVNKVFSIWPLFTPNDLWPPPKTI